MTSETYISRSKILKIEILNQKIEALDELKDQGLGIRVIQDNRLGFAYTSDLSQNSIKETTAKAVRNAQNVAPDEFNSFPSPAPIPSPNIYDEQIRKTLTEQKIKLALEIENSAYKFDPRIKKTNKVAYQDVEYEVTVANSNGIKINFKKNYCGGYAEIVAEENGEAETGFGINYVTSFKDFNPEAIGKEAAANAVEMLKAKSVPSQKIILILDPQIATQFLAALAAMFSADSVQKGKSLLKDKIGQTIASPVVNLIDDGRLSRGLASTPCDAEGVGTQETVLIQAGILQNFLHNTYTAAKDRVNSTGNASRASFKSLPEISPTNFYIKPGKLKPEDLIRNIGKGLYVTKVLGMHTVNPISGDFSIGAAGLMIENGEKTFPVRGITIAGNLIDFLKGIKAVGSDLRFVLNFGSPTLVISDITISGG